VEAATTAREAVRLINHDCNGRERSSSNDARGGNESMAALSEPVTEVPADLPARRQLTLANRSGTADQWQLGCSIGREMEILPKAFLEMGPAVKGCLVAGVTEPFVPPHDPSWEREAETIRASHLAAVALQLEHENSGDHSGLASEVFHRASLNDATKSLAIEFTARRPMQALRDKSIPFVVIKGPAVARFYGRPDTRFFSDIDIMVAPRHYRSAVTVLADCGFKRREGHVQPWPWFERLCVEGANFYDSRGGNLDLHHHIAPWAFSQKLRADEMVHRSEEGILAGMEVRFASASDCLAIACLHVLNDLWKEDPSLQSWRDVFTLMTYLGPEGSHRAFALTGLAWFEEIARTALDSIVPGATKEWERSRHLSVLKRWRLQAMGWNGSSVVARHPAGWAFRLPLGRAMAFTVGGLVPSRNYVRLQHHGYWNYWRESVRSVREAAGGRDVR